VPANVWLNVVVRQPGLAENDIVRAKIGNEEGEIIELADIKDKSEKDGIGDVPPGSTIIAFDGNQSGELLSFENKKLRNINSNLRIDQGKCFSSSVN